ncbi:MAG: hypothetical protein E7267_04880 [Lachnospiraceae bacterium]|nr:hypothetical protein [Lachnospiraceae bacterium]
MMRIKIFKSVAVLVSLALITGVFAHIETKNVMAGDFEMDKKEAVSEMGGYLATYIAAYEPDAGVEFACHPSGIYTDNYRTDVLYYAISTDGKNYTALNHNKPVFYPKDRYKLGSPSIFRKADGTYGLVAAVDNATNQIIVCDSDDMIFYENERIITLNSDDIAVTHPTVKYNETTSLYEVYWEGGDGKSYVQTTKDFSSFSDRVTVDYMKDEFVGELPSYAVKDEAASFAITKDEYTRLMNKYGEVKSVSVAGLDDINVKPGEKVTLPENADVVYSDGSTSNMGVTWDSDSITFDMNNPAEGTYTVKGKINYTDYDGSETFVRFRADPDIEYDEINQVYYMTGSNMNENSANGGGAYNSIVLRQADTIEGLADAEEVEIWTDNLSSPDYPHVHAWYWAPEIHYIGGYWRVISLGMVQRYEGASDEWQQCIFTCYGDDVMDPNNWEFDGYIGTSTDNKALGTFDTTYFEYDGQGYYVSPCKDPSIHWLNVVNMSIVTVDTDNLLQPTSELVELSRCDRAFEYNIGWGMSEGNDGYPVEEGPAVFIHEDKIFISYAGATVDTHYCTCILYADLDSDFMDPASWKKYPYPLLATQDFTGTVKEGVFTGGAFEEGEYEGYFGPGHCNFTIDENGNLVISYHARIWGESFPGATGDTKYGTVDPGRHAFINHVHFGADGFPIFNMTSEQILASSLRDVEITVNVKNEPEIAPTSSPDTTIVNDSDVKKGNTITKSGIKYKVTSVISGKKSVEVCGVANKKIKKAVIPAVIKIQGEKYKVTAIAKKAFKNCKKLKKITIKTKTLKKVGSKAIQGINKAAVIKCPKSKAAAYKKLFNKKSGFVGSMRIK